MDHKLKDKAASVIRVCEAHGLDILEVVKHMGHDIEPQLNNRNAEFISKILGIAISISAAIYWSVNVSAKADRANEQADKAINDLNSVSQQLNQFITTTQVQSEKIGALNEKITDVKRATDSQNDKIDQVIRILVTDGPQARDHKKN